MQNVTQDEASDSSVAPAWGNRGGEWVGDTHLGWNLPAREFVRLLILWLWQILVLTAFEMRLRNNLEYLRERILG